MEQKVTAYLRQMKESRGCTQQQIADESGVPIGTVGKYLAGIADEAAGYDAVRRLVVCLGGSLDELAGIRADGHKTDGDADQAYKAVIAGLEARLSEKDERLMHRDELVVEERRRAQEEIMNERKRAKMAMWVSYVALGLFVVLFYMDFLIPTVGWIKR